MRCVGCHFVLAGYASWGFLTLCAVGRHRLFLWLEHRFHSCSLWSGQPWGGSSCRASCSFPGAVVPEALLAKGFLVIPLGRASDSNYLH